MVIWSEPAKADLRSIHDFIAHDSEHYAKKVAQDIREKMDVLDELPKLGKKAPELNRARRFLCWRWCINGGI